MRHPVRPQKDRKIDIEALHEMIMRRWPKIMKALYEAELREAEEKEKE